MKNWLDKYQDGGTILPVPKSRSSQIREHNSRDNYVMPQNMRQRKDTPEEIAKSRKQRIQASVDAQKIPYTKDNWRQQLAAKTAATGDKMRISDTPNFFDDYVNPAVWVGDMASNLGQAPYQAEQSNSNLPYVASLGIPLAGGALSGLGTNSTGQFINNMFNPLAGINTKKLSKPNYKLITDNNISFQEYGNIMGDLDQVIKDKSIYKDISHTERRSFDRLKQNIEDGESWKINPNDIENSLIKIGEADQNYRHYIDATRAELVNNKFNSLPINKGIDPVYFKGQEPGNIDLLRMNSEPNGDAWSLINASPNKHTKYIADANDLSHLPHIKTEQQAIELTQKRLGKKFDKEMKSYLPEYNSLSNNQDGGNIIDDDMGQWNHPGEITRINSNQITMRNVNYPILGVSDTGDTKMMYPGGEYKFKGKKVTEYPMAQNGKELINFTKNNKSQSGGWLKKYES